MPRRVVPDPSEIPTGICECGCGQPTELAKETYQNKRHFKGYPLPYRLGHSPPKRGAASHKWKGGRWQHKSGYIYVYAPDHPNANRDSYVFEHRLVMEQRLGRYLDPYTEVVHHLNGDKTDNRVENLEVLSPSEHSTRHPGERNYDSAVMSRNGRKGAEARWGTAVK